MRICFDHHPTQQEIESANVVVRFIAFLVIWTLSGVLGVIVDWVIHGAGPWIATAGFIAGSLYCLLARVEVVTK